MKIPIIINNFNLLTWPSKMLDVCKTFEDVGDLIIIDNNSTYEPLLDWYKTNPCDIIYCNNNNGQSCPWILDIPNKLGYKYYVVTDPDLDITYTPKDCLIFLREKMEKYQEYSKIGLSLENWQVSENSPYYHHLKNWAITNWDEDSIFDGLLTNQIFDTTFGLYNLEKNINSGKNCTTYKPYSAKHIPWEITNDIILDMENKNYEYFYYLSNATSASSYKAFTSFNN